MWCAAAVLALKPGSSASSLPFASQIPCAATTTTTSCSSCHTQAGRCPSKPPLDGWLLDALTGSYALSK
ncbi:hypothetical protein VPH35_065871 [Triticum aestivum]